MGFPGPCVPHPSRVYSPNLGLFKDLFLGFIFHWFGWELTGLSYGQKFFISWILWKWVVMVVDGFLSEISRGEGESWRREKKRGAGRGLHLHPCPSPQMLVAGLSEEIQQFLDQLSSLQSLASHFFLQHFLVAPLQSREKSNLLGKTYKAFLCLNFIYVMSQLYLVASVCISISRHSTFNLL